MQPAFFKKMTPPNKSSEAIYHLHRIALKPLLPDTNEQALIDCCMQIESIGEDRFLEFLQDQCLVSMWHKKLRSTKNTHLVADRFMASLHQSRMLATGIYMLQSQALKKIKSSLDNENISHVVFKGCHIRELIYDKPAVRPACDIDVLISPDEQIKAIRALVNAGYQLTVNPEIISHEVTLFKGDISIDLHWDIMRPGRTRIPMTEILLKTRTEFPTHWGLSNEATLFLMLVHPVFTKYATSPNSPIMRIVDLSYWINQRELDWEQVFDWLDMAGVRTCGWIMLECLEQLTGIVSTKDFKERIQPGKLKKSYLRHWLKKNYSSQFYEQPLVIQVAFTLPAHDKLSDAMRAITSLIQAKKSAKLTAHQIEKNVLAANNFKSCQ